MKDYIDQFIAIGDEFHSIDFLEWLGKYVLVEDSGQFKPFTFENHEPLAEIYSLYNHPRITLRKGAQLGLSTYSSLVALYLGIRFGISTAYFFPTDYHMYDFVGSKFEPLIFQTPILRNLTRDAVVDNKGLKVFNGFTIYFRGLWSKLQAKSITVDHTIKDELDEADQENAKFAEDRMLHSKHRLVKELSQPSVENFGIDMNFKKSDQRFWGVKCFGCNTWNFPDETFPDCLMTRGSTTYLGCYKCSRKLNVKKGKWIAKYPDKSKSHAGFQLSHLIMSVMTPERILKEFKSIENSTERKRFYISILGRPHSDPTTQPITLNVLQSLESDYAPMPEHTDSIVGIDVGDKCHLVFGHLKSNQLRIHWFAEMLSDNKDQIIWLLQRQGVKVGLIDAGPYKTFSKDICRAMDNKVWLHYLRKVDDEKQSMEGQGDLSVPRIITDRTESLDNLMGYIQDDRIVLPSYKKSSDLISPYYDMFRSHCQFLIKETIVRPNGTVELAYKKNVPNHFGMALNSCSIAAFRLLKSSITYEDRFQNGYFY
jgi:hypothetical protein